MTDDELDNWLLEHNARLVADTHARIDVSARYARVLDDVAGTSGSEVLARTKRTERRIAVLATALSVAGMLVVLLVPGDSSVPGHLGEVVSVGSGTEASSAETPGTVVLRSQTGPAGLTTAVPVGWRSRPSPAGPGAFEVSDPTSDRSVRYGATSTTVGHTFDLHVDYEGQYAASRRNYERIQLSPTTFRGADAVIWEFEFDPDSAPRRHVSVLYWTMGSYEYFVHASGPAGQWHDMQTIFDAMIARTRVG